MTSIKLQTPRLVLREFRPEDVDDVLSIIGDDRVTQWLSFDSRTRVDAQRMVEGATQHRTQEPRNEYYLAIAKTRTDQVLGFTRLGFNGVRAAKLGYAIRYDEWHQGYATEAVRETLVLAFNKLNLHRVSAAIGPDNNASIRLVKRLGFIEEGCIRDHVFTNGSWRDSVLFGILADEMREGMRRPAAREGFDL